MARTPIEGIELIEPTPLSVEQALAVHDPLYVNAVRTGVPRALAESQGFDWDENVWPMVLSSSGGAVEAALAALKDGVADRCRVDCIAPIVHKAEDYMPTIERALGRMRTRKYDLVIYNAGMDPYEGSATGGMRGITRATLAERERIVFEHCRAASIPIAFVLAGVYVGPELDEDGLVDLHRLTLIEAARSLR